jgi:hypothetical protein
MAMTRFYHGGKPGLKVGGKVLPPVLTNASGPETLHEYGSLGRWDRVYLTTSEATARMYASGHPSRKGCVYEVTPDGDVEPDPDCLLPGLSYECASATIVRVIKLSSSARNRALRRAAASEGQFR